MHACLKPTGTKFHTVDQPELIWPLAFGVLTKTSTSQAEVQLHATLSAFLPRHVFAATAAQELPVVIPRETMLGQFAGSMAFLGWGTEDWEDQRDTATD